ncbi:MAG: nucleotidyltransferase [Candidatus Omnitrophota bacterium]
MNPVSIQLKALSIFLSKQKIDYAILGGIAVFIYGEPRLTSDVDVNIALDKDDIRKFLKDGKRYGFAPAIPGALRTGKTMGVIPMKFSKGKVSGLFDFILAENILELNAIKRARTKKIGPVSMKVVTPEDLVIHKITSRRARDFEDIPGILIRQKGKLDLKYINKWLKMIDKIHTGLNLYKKFASLLRKAK